MYYMYTHVFHFIYNVIIIIYDIYTCMYILYAKYFICAVFSTDVHTCVLPHYNYSIIHA